MFDLTINLGSILQIVAMVGGGIWFLFSIKTELIKLSVVQETFASKIVEIEVELKKLSEVTIDMARQAERMTAQDNRLNILAARVEELSRTARNSKG